MKTSIAFELIEVESNEVVSSATEETPFIFEKGAGDIDQFLEASLQQVKVGDEFEFNYSAAQSYGDLDDSLVEEIDIQPFLNDDGEPLEGFAIGNILQLSDEQGVIKDGVLLDYNDKFAVIDFNHPLAGTDLVFKGKVLSKD